jgi:ribonuclease P protein component
VVVHAATTSDDQSAGAPRVRVGLVVSKAVGGSVVRSRVKRRLRHLAAAELTRTPAGTDLVLRALPAAATRPQQLPADLTSGWQHALRSLDRRRTGGQMP